jgi:hypothetical protein
MNQENRLNYILSEDFYRGIYELTRLGLTFECDPNTLVIILTGGY